MSRHNRRSADIGLSAITIEGGLISPAQIALIAATAPDLKAALDYGCPKGTNLRDEITRYFRISQAHWQAYTRIERPNSVQASLFVKAMLEDGFGFGTLTGPHRHRLEDHDYRITFEGRGGRVPIVVTAPLADADAFTKSLPELGDKEGGTIARRSPYVLLQDWLNANDKSLWGLCFAGDRLRLMRDNASITRQAYIEADLGAIFRDEMFADFTALWLMIHASRFGGENAADHDCPLERWRVAGHQAGTAARDRLRVNVEDALMALGQGFLDANPDFRARLDGGSLAMNICFEQLLRIVYRMIFMAVAEDRDLLHGRNVPPQARALYREAYGFDYLRDRAARRVSHDHHHDAWEGMKIVFTALENGERLLALPALGGLFSSDLTRDLNELKLPNKASLLAVFRLSYLIEKGQRVRINWRDMATEELGSVYESLLELVPIREDQGRRFAFAGGAETKGNSRKVSGSYYTPDSLVQALLDTTLNPVLDKAEAEGGADAILRLSVIDPACGSGHFLLGAARRMATRVAQLRDPDAPDYNAAMRDVVRNCIHGVDRNPMAVELTKVALWIETVDPGKPLGFLDANIRCGDSLLGVFDLKVLEKGIPDAAYKALTGDDKEAAKLAGKVNKQQRETKTRDLFAAADAADLAAAAKKLHDMAEDSPAQLKAKADAFSALRRGTNWWAKKTACDLYIAAFLHPKHFRKSEMATSKALDLVPTTLDVRNALAGSQGSPQLTALAIDLAGLAYAFHWPLEFADVMAAGGFDIVIGNPPWERIKLQEQEFFATRDPDIATAANASERAKLIKELEKAGAGSPRRALFDEFETAKRVAEASSIFARVPGEEGGRFPLTGRGDVNTYALFAENFLRLAQENGRAGTIVPTGIATDATTAPFFGNLVETERLSSLVDFENRDALFEDVHRSFKFCLLTLGSGVKSADFSFFLSDPSQMQDEARQFRLSPQQIAKINPNTKTVSVFRSKMDANLTAKLYDKTPVLVDNSRLSSQGGWDVKLRTMFHKSNAATSGEIRTARSFGNDGHISEGWLPLYEGDYGFQYDHRYSTFQGTQTIELRSEEKVDPNFEPRFEWVGSKSAFLATLKHWRIGEDVPAFLAFRRVARSTDERTCLAAILPFLPTANNWIITLSNDVKTLTLLCANYNSLVFDYCLRNSLSQPSIPQGIFEQCPIVTETSYGNSEVEFVTSRVIELSYTSESLRPFAKKLNYQGNPFIWSYPRRALLKSELDAFYAIKYGLARDELRYILDPTDVMGADYPSETFRVLKNKEIKEFGEYRTRRLVLEAYDRLVAEK
ncbi:Eco57I restriction-modification methylase domain-containing protein [Phyllobacterium endophyticum]|uniref:Eco57I restriction-modification methylase domain-containing protein n=1 Tax=Phyllobacterium endophyticum TaxID=1149773 RepID=UPI0011CAEB50|nr:N-6 DNA methylase [Phyllobacterium endophyticum]TXR47502.1 N-6 DNA methylase [Phyllobacterium endophyticum]